MGNWKTSQDPSFRIGSQIDKMVSYRSIARTSRTILKSYGESGQPCLVPDFRGIALSFSPFSLMLAVGLLYIVFIMFGGYRST
ncbi:hypothetical protein H671_6g16224 [Cricetulus griseus]|nr:hypothetical protein H671_6g16224 [Cricetulus griseus]